jgi:rod shape-determining protein MreD
MPLRAQTETHIEVYRFSWWAVALPTFLALVLQAFLPVYVQRADLLELPLLITLYFGLSRRNPATGLLLGTTIGLLQDGVSGNPLGLYGIAKTFVGYGASSIGGRLDVEHPVSRFFLTLAFFHVHQIVFAATRRVLLAQPENFFSIELFAASVVNAVLAVVLFPLLDKLRKPS